MRQAQSSLALVVLLLPGLALARQPGKPAKPPPAGRARVVPRWPRRPDPKPLRTARYLELRVRLAKGALSVLGITRGRFPAGPTLIKRFRGRFEARLFAHGLLLDVVRFGFPLGAAAENRSPGASGTSLGDRLDRGLAREVTARATVRVPWPDRLTRMTIVDTLTREQQVVDLRGVVGPLPRPEPQGNLRVRTFGRRPPPAAPPTSRPR